MSVKRSRIHVTVADGGQRLDTEEKAIEEPTGAGSPGDAVLVDAVKNREDEDQANVNSADKQRELRPAQAQQPAINIAPLPRVGIYFNKFDLARPDRNFIAPPSPLANFLVHEPM